MERQKFEDEWKDAFSEAEVTPSDNLWTNIELDLMKAEGEKMKRRLVFYKLMAAASIAFAMCVAGIGVYFNNKNLSGNGNQLSGTATQTIHQPKAIDQKKAESLSLNVKANTASTYPADNSTRTSIDKKEDRGDELKSNSRMLKGTTSSKQSISMSEGVAKNKIGNDEMQSSIDLTVISKHTKDKNYIDERGQVVNAQFITNDNSRLALSKIPPLYTPRKLILTFPETQPDPVLVMIAKLEQREIELRGDKQRAKNKSKNKELNEKLWTTIGFSAGTFTSGNSNVYAASNAQNTPNNSFGRSASASTSNKVSNQSKSSGSYSLGLSVGTKLSKHWVLQGGVNYLAQNSIFAVNSVIETSDKDFRILSKPTDVNHTLSPNTMLDPNAERVVATSSYDVSNNSQFISLPVQAGYMAVNRKFGVQVNAGISTDLFLKNTIDAGSRSSLPKATQQGEDSFYRPVNFSGLFGTEFSYRMGSHYRISVIPGLRYPFNSIYKDQVQVVSTPLTLDVGMKFRYIFN